MTEVSAVLERLRRTTDTIVGETDLAERLASSRPLRIKYGVDCTAPDLHLGHAVNLWMMRHLQDLGHKVVFLLGDLTTRIGDPTGRSETRPVLTPEEIETNAGSFLEQVSLVLRTEPEVFEVRRNSEWYDAMDVATLLGLFSQVTHAQLMARDMFRERVAAGREIALHELTYPVLQGYDSFAINSDLTIVGSDQLFNEQLGRHFQQRLGAAPQVVITSTITPGIDGGPKQSKSRNNYIGLTDTPRDKFGKVMSLPDSLVQTYAHVYTELPLDVVAGLGEAATQGGPPAREAKLRLASAIVTRYHGANIAKAERETFIQLFSEASQPTDLPEVIVEDATVLELLLVARPGDSRSELRRLISQGAVSLDGRKLSDPNEPITLTGPMTLRSGRRTWHRLVPRA
ncbi:tyrosyl-tRNA synthetase [Kribbella orskensis]|uniref:Tyrosine--tRNA ligase n=1 Tax=Kribbella orskensis TaxID=2512216 RepID=A0ABY2BUH8_9ACTN|nr:MULTISPECIES: tyrosine--tRNA ligase [Kribbella]TCN44591.1 tyrosyl-tRNA synthetase [Kribbella sp. VKM Ac-2500]TCO31631.1 tyrosyl-tRNA synthetase [Kribbella orskensis]